MQNIGTNSTQFASVIAGVPVLLSSDWTPEYFQNIEVFPLPSESARLVGIVQIRGEVVPVFDPTVSRNLVSHARRKISVTVVKTESGLLGFAVDSEPFAIKLGAVAFATTPDCVFSEALSQPRSGALLGADANPLAKTKAWWQLDIDRFFKTLNVQPLDLAAA